MVRAIHPLSPAAVRTAKPGMHCDGGGLYLQCTVGPHGRVARSWIFRFAGRDGERKMGLGSAMDVSLAEARKKALACRQLRTQGVDPIEHRQTALSQARIAAANDITFDAARDAYLGSHQAGWRNLKHAKQWKATLSTYASPVFGTVPVGAVDTALVMRVLESIWATKPETASRVRGRIEAILDWARVRGYREGENPARWRGHLDHLLPARSKVREVKHHAALPYADLPKFMTDLAGHESVAAQALRFTILTAARTGETIGARWDEINFAERVWTVPASRMKAGKEHRVPLSDAAIAVLERMAKSQQGDFIFGGDGGRPLSNMAMAMLLRRMEYKEITVHGFRSSFRDWAAEGTNFPAEVAEMALAHTIRNKAEAAYRRGYLLNKRRRLIEERVRQARAPAPRQRGSGPRRRRSRRQWRRRRREREPASRPPATSICPPRCPICATARASAIIIPDGSGKRL
jgi:integrase